jgi:streptomycin 6-kinase
VAVADNQKTMEGLSSKFVTVIPEHYGSVGVRWLDKIDDRLDRYLKRWELRRLNQLPMTGGRSLIIPCLNKRGKEVVLKMCPDPLALQREHDGLRHWQTSDKTVKVVRGNGARGAFVLEKLQGPMPTSLDEDILLQVAEVVDAIHGCPGALAATSAEQHISSIMAHCIGRISHPRVASLVATEDLKQAIDGALSLSLSADLSDMALLHGDLHLENLIVDPKRGLTAIDPKPFIGERAAEIAFLVRNAGPVYELSSRIERASLACAVDPERTLAWTRVVLLDTAISHARFRKSSTESINAMVRFCRSGQLP